LMQEGFEDRNGERIQGLREILEQLRRERAERLENHDLGGVYDEINDELRELTAQERQALEDRNALADMELGDPDASDEAQRNAELAKETTTNKQMQLDVALRLVRGVGIPQLHVGQGVAILQGLALLGGQLAQLVVDLVVDAAQIVVLQALGPLPAELLENLPEALDPLPVAILEPLLHQ
ncbi:MAG: hypothetical protein AAGK32_22580, partial [Actinomycetota bacterium]